MRRRLAPIARLSRLALLTVLVGSAVSCRGCWCTNLFHAFTDAPPKELVREEAEKKLRKDPSLASELCGVSLEGLKNVVLEVTSQTAGVSTVHITADPTEPAESDAGAQEGLDVKKALVCAGVLTVILVPILDGDGKETGWKLSSIEIAGIETEGVKFDEAKHHHHHHHH